MKRGATVTSGRGAHPVLVLAVVGVVALAAAVVWVLRPAAAPADTARPAVITSTVATAGAGPATSREVIDDKAMPGPAPRQPDDHAPAAASTTATAPAGATKPFDFNVPQGVATAGRCAFPTLARTPQAGDAPPYKLYAAGAYAGRKLGFQIDQSGNGAGRIDVAVNHPGQPVALMLGSYDPTVWHIGWAPGTRIVAVLVGGYHRQVVTGLPQDVPLIVSTYDNKGPCGYFYVTAEKAATLNPVARRAFGRGIDMVYPAQKGSVLVGEPMRDASALVTDASAQDDTAFRLSDAQAAGEAGLAYAVSRGWLREATQADADAWLAARAARPQADVPPVAGGRPPGRISMHNGYVVLQPFRLPAGLYGAHSATFFVPRGVPRPSGELGHSVLYDFNTLTCAGTLCAQR